MIRTAVLRTGALRTGAQRAGRLVSRLKGQRVTEPPRRSLVLIRNPKARRAPSEQELIAGCAPLRAAGWDLELRATIGPGDATALASEAACAGAGVVVAVGGDGTVNEVVNGLAGSDAALAVVPAGTANVWAAEAGIPRGVGPALAWVTRARSARVDLGVAAVDGTGEEPRRFLLMCSAGFDAEVVRRVGEGAWRKRRLGRAWYGAVGGALGLRAKPVAARIEVDGQVLERDLLFAVAGNTRLYGGMARLASDARMDDGLLDLCAFSGGGLWHRLQLTGRGMRGALHERAGGGIDYARGQRIRIEAARPLAVQADGEDIGDTPLTLSVEPGALTVLLDPRPNVLLGDTNGTTPQS